jgi:hypothetical protein
MQKYLAEFWRGGSRITGDTIIDTRLRGVRPLSW